MTTRTNIKIVDTDCEILLYKHSDGYPQGVIPILRKYISDPTTTLHILAKKMVKNHYCEIVTENVPGMEYYYEVDLMTKEIKAYKVAFDTIPNPPMEAISFTPAELGELAVIEDGLIG